MAQRFCHRCGSDVEDAGGFCLLGHGLAPVLGTPPPPPPPVMDDLTAEMESVFDAALATIQAPAEAPEEPRPAPSRYVSSIDRTWAELESAAPPSADDPINTFAPPPRMDWGPARAAGRFRLRRGRVEASV
ncbi:MAG: hypothetical protein M3323_11165 [Actinomycetota bacterium]|nr:hypothetical protein [Actinomycetota bacterium]